MSLKLQSKIYEFQHSIDAIEHYISEGWTDGLPIVPPTQEKTKQMLIASGLEPEEIIGEIPERKKVFTAEKVAINAVMAGCLPEYFPVVVTALRALSDPRFNVHGPSASTAGPAMLIIVSGPIAKKIGMNSGQRLFSSGNRANATIGRAIGLVLRNLGGGRDFERSTFGHPGKYTYCIAEQEVDWLPLHVERGFKAHESTVTVFAGEAPNQVNNHVATTWKGVLLSIADRMTSLTTTHMRKDQQMVVILGPEHYKKCLANGMDKQDVKQFLFKHACRPIADLKKHGVLTGDITEEDKHTMKYAVPSPDDMILLVAGGQAGGFSVCIPGWSEKVRNQSMTRLIDSCVEH